MGVESWWQAIDPAETAFFLDVDGTLLGFQPRPGDVIADAALLALLRDLDEAAAHAVALVSGRTIADLDRIMFPLVLPAAGTHGAELRFADGRREHTDTAALDDVRTAVASMVERHPGLAMEDKGASIAIHYRARPDLQGAIAGSLEALVVRDDLMIQHGKMVAEIKASSHHKGTAIAVLMGSPPFVGRKPLFIGDDLTDEHGFRIVNGLNGTTVKVSDGDTAAKHRLAGVDDVRAALTHIGEGATR